MDRDHRRFDRHAPVSIQMPYGLIEELSKDVSPLASFVLHSAGTQPRPSRLRRCWQTVGHEPPGRATVCGWGFLSCSWQSSWVNLADWDGCYSRADNLRVDQSFLIYKCQDALRDRK